VYYDGQRVGQVEYLRSVMVSSVGRIRYVNGYEAERRLGKDHSGGVLYIYVAGCRLAPALGYFFRR
jgi:hypothetical protein